MPWIGFPLFSGRLLCRRRWDSVSALSRPDNGKCYQPPMHVSTRCSSREASPWQHTCLVLIARLELDHQDTTVEAAQAERHLRVVRPQLACLQRHGSAW